MRKVLVSFLFILSIVASISGCGSSQATTSDDRIVGKWEQVGGTFPATVEFTHGGTIVWSIKGRGEEVGKFTLSDGVLAIAKSDANEQVEYRIDFTGDDEFLLGDDYGPILGGFSVMEGRWRRVGSGKAAGSEHDQQLADLTAKRDRLRRLLAEREADKSILLARLTRYDAEDRSIDDGWKIHARELKSLISQIALLKQRIGTLDKAITRLEFAARSDRRTAELQELGLSEDELNKVSQTIHELEDEMKTAGGGPADDVELEALVEQELRRRESTP